MDLKTFACLSLTTLSSFSFSLKAEEAPAPQRPPRFTSQVQAGFASQVDAELDGGSSFTSSDAYVDLGFRRMIQPRFFIGGNLGLGQKSYDFSGNTNISPSDPWSDIRRVELGLSFTWIQDQWVFFAAPSLNSYYEQGADMEDALTAGVVTAAIYQVNERLQVGLGLGVAGQVEDDPEVFPFPIITWQITERLRLENGEGFAATLGPGLGLFYDMTPNWTAGLLGRNSLFRFRLDDEGSASEGVGEESHTALYAHLDYAISASASVSLFAGYQFDGELRLEDKSGDKLAEEEYDQAVVLGLFTEFSF